MDAFEQALSSRPGGRVLDVATGRGGFIAGLLDVLPGYDEIIGIDNSPRAAETAPNGDRGNVFNRPGIRFMPMDAGNLDFTDGSFDLVTISNSLHHMENPQRVLQEMIRVLRPGGRIVVSEMYRDGQTESQETHVRMHHWWAQVDRALGVFHRETYTRAELSALLAPLGLDQLALYDFSDLSTDPFDPELTARLNTVLDEYLEKAKDLPGFESIRKKGEQLRARLQTVGLHWATCLTALGEKAES